MKRLATLVLAAGFSMSSLVAMGQGASATPFSDVPANHWAYQAIQSLAADGLVEGYPDGKFKGDRPLTRYEMAVLVARVIAKLQANGAGYASKADLDKLQKLIDALKDELDSLGVRVTNLEDALDALDKRTKFAQSIQLHGTLTQNNSFRQRTIVPETITHGAADGYIAAFLTSPLNNSPLEQTGPGALIRLDDKLNFTYTINENLTVSLPMHLINYDYGGHFSNTGKFTIEPDIIVNVAKAGALTNLYLREGSLDNLKSSRVGLTYRAPDATQQGPGFENPVQPYEKGFEVGGVLSGLTEFQASFSRVDQTYINTLTSVEDQQNDFAQNNYFFMRVPSQAGYIQGSAPVQTYSFTAQTPTNFVYLPNKAVVGTVYISSYGGTACYPAGTVAGSGVGTANPSCLGFYFIDNDNRVVFTRPVPVGTTVVITYNGTGFNNNSEYQRYHINARLNQKFKGLPGAEVGVSFSRIYDFTDFTQSGGSQFYFSSPNGNAAGNGYGAVSDTVFGLDFQAPIPGLYLGDKTQPLIVYGEGAYSKYTPDYMNIPAITDSAAVIGLRLKVHAITASLQYQSVGKNFLSGAPFRYYGPAPTTFSQWNQPFFPQFFGFANTLAINQTFDGAMTAAGRVSATAASPNNTFIYPVYNPFVASGPQFFSAFAPNSQGFTLNGTAPIRIGDMTFNGNLLAQHLEEQQANGYGQLTFNGVATSNQKLKFDKVGGGVTFSLPVFAQKVAFNLSGDYEHLTRHDITPYAYVPYTAAGAPTAQTGIDAGANVNAGAYAAAGNAPVLYYPNYVDMRHTTLAAGASLPVAHDIVFGLLYNTQQYGGSYGTTIGQNISQRKDQYQATLTYNIPKTTSSISALFRNQQYKDNVLPTYNFNNNREDLSFTVRF